MTTKVVSPKVAGASVAAAVSVIIVWLVGLSGLDVPEYVSGAFTVILTFVGGYVLPDPLRSSDIVD